MVSSSDHWVMKTWLYHYANQFERLVILDGSKSNTAKAAVLAATKSYRNVIYSHESAHKKSMVNKSDNSLRYIAFELLNKNKVLDNWVIIAHCDEFYLQRFDDLVQYAETKGCNNFKMGIIYGMPYWEDHIYMENEIKKGFQKFDITKSIRYNVKGYRWSEQRAYRYTGREVWVKSGAGGTLPAIFPNKQPC
eukprot:gene28753-38006_t